jgi:arylsulfatase A-like enzyme
MEEGGHRVPGIVRWPGHVKPGTTSDVPVIGTDIFPTALAAAGVPLPDDRTIDGANLMPLFAGGAVERRSPLYWRWGGKVAYREGDWKIVTSDPPKGAELFNLAVDRAEAHDLAAKEPERVSGMLERLAAFTAEVEAEAPDWWRKEPGDGLRKERRRREPAAP